MDTYDRYLDCQFGVRLADTRCVGRKQRSYNVPDRGLGGIKRYRRSMDDGTKVFVDGWLTFYWPDRPEDEPHIGPAFSFRDHSKDGRWFAEPHNESFSKRPVWKWQNPDESLSEITLNPSLGLNGDDGLWFHCWVKNGEIEWL